MNRKITNCIFILVLSVLSFNVIGQITEPKRYYYQIKIYHFENEMQQKTTERYLQNAFRPALHRAGIKSVVFFEPAEKGPGDQLFYVFIPFESFREFEELEIKLEKDRQYHTEGKEYIDAAYNNMAYKRSESIFLRAFSGMPGFDIPPLGAPRSQRIYDLRSYESSSEKYHHNKVEMFNSGGEMALFKNHGFNAVFYGEVLFGSRMPNLMYMTAFNNRQDRDEHFSAFGKDPKVKELFSTEKYKHNVSKADIFLLRSVEYSDF